MLARIDARPQRLRHIAQRPRQRADLVAAGGQARHHHFARAPLPHADRGARQPPQRLDDGPRQKQRQQDRQDGNRRQHQPQSEPLGAHGAGDVPCIGGDQQAVGIIGRHQTDAQHRCAVGGKAIGGYRSARRIERVAQLRPCRQPVLLWFGIVGRTVGQNRPVQQAVEPPRQLPVPSLDGGVAQCIGRRGQAETVGSQRAVRPISADAALCRLAKAAEHSGPIPRVSHIERNRQHFRIMGQAVEPGFDQPGAIAVEIEKPADQQHYDEDVHREYPRGQRRRPLPAPLLDRLDITHR